MCHVTLNFEVWIRVKTFEVWIRVKVTAHRLNEENICTKLDGNPAMHTLVIVRRRNVTDGRTDGLTDGQSALL